MTIPNPEHYFQQADGLIAARTSGPVRQVDLRRAVSAVYYGVFHALAALAADRVLGTAHRTSAHYSLVYRAIDHRWLRELCGALTKSSMPNRYRTFVPAAGLGPEITTFATAVAELQERRHAADYDPIVRFKSSDARGAIAVGRAALRNLDAAPAAAADIFLTLVLFPPRR